MIDQQAVVKLGTGSRVVNSVPEGQSGGVFHRGVGCPQLLHGRTANRSSFFTRQPLTVTFTLDQYSGPLNDVAIPGQRYLGTRRCSGLLLPVERCGGAAQQLHAVRSATLVVALG